MLKRYGLVVIAAGLSLLGLGLSFRTAGHRSPEAEPVLELPQGIGCLGRIEPEDGVRRLAAPSFLGPSLISQLFVKEGDEVREGQVLTILDNHARLRASWEQAQADVKIARAQLELVKEGAKAGDLASQEAEAARHRAECAQAESELRRARELHRQALISQSELETKETAFQTARQLVVASAERLRSLSEIRASDIRLAEARLESMRAAATSRKAEFDQSLVRSPMCGKILKIHAHPGEAVGDKGIASLAALDRMAVIAEVYEADVARVRLGQTVRINGAAFSETLHGSVVQIGLEVGKGNLVSPDPATFADTRVIEVKIRLEGSAKAAALTGARVVAQIGL